MRYYNKKFNNSYFGNISWVRIVLGFSAVILGIFVAFQVARAEWHEPDQEPPTEEFYAPLTTGGENQAKKGYLLIDPENYNPTKSTSLVFTVNKPLEVKGAGAYFSVPNYYTGKLSVDSDTLYVDSINDWVGIGTNWRSLSEISDNVVLKVEGGSVKVGTEETPVNGTSVEGISSGNIGVYSEASGLPSRGAIYALNSSTGGWALKGEVDGLQPGQVGVRGESSDGYGIYAVNDSQTNAAVYGSNSGTGWAGYFDGPLGVGNNIVAERFISSAAGNSVVPFTAGEKIGYYEVNEVMAGGGFHPAVAFDGTYVWAANVSPDQANGNNLVKVRASDGKNIQKYKLTGQGGSIYDMKYDGQYLWIASLPNYLIKFDPLAGAIVSSCSTLAGTSNWGSQPENLEISEIDGQIYVWTANKDGSDLTKFDANCSQIGVYPLGTQGTGNDFNRINEDGWRVKPSSIEFGGGYIWVVTPSLCGTTAPAGNGICASDLDCGGTDTCQEFSNTLIKINPDDGSVVGRYSVGINDPEKVYYDGYYLWLLSSPATSSGKIVKLRADDGQIMDGYPKDLGCVGLSMVDNGNNLWVACAGSEASDPANSRGAAIKEINLATDEITSRPYVLSTNTLDNALIFDGSYIWSLSSCDDSGDCSAGGDGRQLRLTKLLSGQGGPQADQSSFAQLSSNSGICQNLVDPPSSSNIQCLYDRDCPNFTGTFGTNGNGEIDYDRFSSSTQDGFGLAIDSLYMYAVGYNDSNDWQIEKRKLFDGKLCIEDAVNGNPCSDAFGDGDGNDGDGIIISGSASNAAYDVAIDSNYIYVTGDDASGNWRVEKRKKTDGQLCTGGLCGGVDFSADGILDGETESQIAYGVAVDSNYIYVVGVGDMNNDGSPDAGRIAKYDKVTGALCTGGACGAGQSFGRGTCSNPTPSNYYCDSDADCSAGETCDGIPTGFVQYNIGEVGSLRAIEVDSTYMYVAGDQGYIEKRRLDTGAFDTNFDGDGHLGGSSSDNFNSIELDGGDIYVADSASHIEKRSAATGAYDASFGVSGVITSADTYDYRELQSDGSYLYAVGMSGELGYNWRLEKRSAATGAYDASFGTGGFASTSSGESGKPYDIQIDSDYAYIFGTDNTSTTRAWRLEKRQITGASQGNLGNKLANEVCSVSNEAQKGSISIGGSLYIGSGHCYSNLTQYYDRLCVSDADCGNLPGGQCIGGNASIGGDVQASNNVWGGSLDAEISLSGGTAICPSGYFIKGIFLDTNSRASKIYCRPL